VKRVLMLLVVAIGTVGCGRSESPAEKAAARLAKAEAAMESCKLRNGLASTPTPGAVILDDPATRGQPLTPETTDQLRMKVQCRPELDELLGARRAAGAGG
jgi:hypothetical protein